MIYIIKLYVKLKSNKWQNSQNRNMEKMNLVTEIYFMNDFDEYVDEDNGDEI